MVKNLKKLREEHGYSQANLAEKLGISQQSVNKYENSNTEPDISTLVEIANIFNTSVDYLVGNTDISHKIEPVSKYSLNASEVEFMDHYRELSEYQKTILKQTAKAFDPKK